MPFSTEDLRGNATFKLASRGNSRKSTAMSIYQHIKENRQKYPAYTIEELVSSMENVGCSIKKGKTSIVNAIRSFNSKQFRKTHNIPKDDKLKLAYLNGKKIVGLEEDLRQFA